MSVDLNSVIQSVRENGMMDIINKIITPRPKSNLTLTRVSIFPANGQAPFPPYSQNRNKRDYNFLARK